MYLTRRKAVESDVPFLMHLRRESMDRHLKATGVSTSDAEHLERLRYRFDCAEVLLEDNSPVGLLKVARDGGDWQIIQIQLVSKLQGRGLGTTLLKQVIAEAIATGASLSLSVLRANPARSLYARLGFVVESESEYAYNMRHQV